MIPLFYIMGSNNENNKNNKQYYALTQLNPGWQRELHINPFFLQEHRDVLQLDLQAHFT